jgi:hypothetical protein
MRWLLYASESHVAAFCEPRSVSALVMRRQYPMERWCASFRLGYDGRSPDFVARPLRRGRSECRG